MRHYRTKQNAGWPPLYGQPQAATAAAGAAHAGVRHRRRSGHDGGVHNILAEYLALPENHRFLHMFHSIGHSPNVEVPTRCAGVLDRFVSQTVSQCLASGSSTR